VLVIDWLIQTIKVKTGEKLRLCISIDRSTRRLCAMLIRVVYSDNQILFCNADCVAVNLLSYVRKQTGNFDCEVDLADETGKPLCAAELRICSL